MQEALRIARRERTQTRTRGVALGRSDDAEWLAAVRMSRKRGLDAVLPPQSEGTNPHDADSVVGEETVPRYLGTGPRARDPLLSEGPAGSRAPLVATSPTPACGEAPHTSSQVARPLLRRGGIRCVKFPFFVPCSLVCIYMYIHLYCTPTYRQGGRGTCVGRAAAGPPPFRRPLEGPGGPGWHACG